MPKSVNQRLLQVIEELITEHGVDTFYVGQQGEFDKAVCAALKMLKNRHPHITCFSVLAYMPTGSLPDSCFPDTIYPEGLERCPYRYCISKRNSWMLDHSQYVVTYVQCSAGGAAFFESEAKKKNKKIISVCE